MVHGLETLKRLNDEAVKSSLQAKPLAVPAIVITRDLHGCFDVTHNGKIADGLCFEELLGLIASICIPFDTSKGKPSPKLLMWLKSPEEKKAWEDRLQEIANKEDSAL